MNDKKRLEIARDMLEILREKDRNMQYVGKQPSIRPCKLIDACLDKIKEDRQKGGDAKVTESQPIVQEGGREGDVDWDSIKSVAQDGSWDGDVAKALLQLKARLDELEKRVGKNHLALDADEGNIEQNAEKIRDLFDLVGELIDHPKLQPEPLEGKPDDTQPKLGDLVWDTAGQQYSYRGDRNNYIGFVHPDQIDVIRMLRDALKVIWRYNLDNSLVVARQIAKEALAKIGDRVRITRKEP